MIDLTCIHLEFLLLLLVNFLRFLDYKDTLVNCNQLVHMSMLKLKKKIKIKFVKIINISFKNKHSLPKIDKTVNIINFIVNCAIIFNLF